MPIPGFENILSSGGQSSNLMPSSPITHTNQMPGFDFQTMYGYGQQQNQGGGWLSNLNMKNISQGVNAFSTLAGIYGMFKSLGLQEDAFKFGKKSTKRNFNAQATGFNNRVNQYEAAREASAANRGDDLSSLAKYGSAKVDRWE